MWISTANRRWTGLGTMALKTRSTQNSISSNFFSHSSQLCTSITSPLTCAPSRWFSFQALARPEKLPSRKPPQPDRNPGFPPFPVFRRGCFRPQRASSPPPARLGALDVLPVRRQRRGADRQLPQ